MKLTIASLLLASVLTRTEAISAPAPVYPYSDPRCPAYPAPASGASCGPYTYKYCDSVTATCPACKKQAPAYGLTYTGYVDPPKDYLIDVGDYMFYHMLHVEYLVYFSKNPTPYQKPLSLPYCGLGKYENHHYKRGWWKDAENAVKKAGTDITKGIAAIRESSLIV